MVPAKYISVGTFTHKVVQASIISASVEVAGNPRKDVHVSEEYNQPDVMALIGI